MSNILRSQTRSRRRRPDVLAHLAENVRRLRHVRQLSQTRLAQLAGISRRMIVAIERSEANISLSSVDKLAAAMGVSFAEIVRSGKASHSCKIQTIAWRGSHPESQAILLGAAPAAREAELWIWSLGEGERYPSEADSGNWHEMLLVIDGVLIVETSAKTQKLRPGDFLIFSSARPYVFANGGDGVVRFVRNVVL